MDEVDRGKAQATTMQKISSGRGSDHQIRGELNTTAMKKLRIATLNVCTLKGVKSRGIRGCSTSCRSNRSTSVLCRRRASLTTRTRRSCRWPRGEVTCVTPVSFYNPAKGSRQCDCLALSKVPMQRLKDNHEGARRMVISAIHRDSMQPLLLANLHGDGSCKASIRAQMCHALETARRNARTLVVIGDYNLTPEEGAVSEALPKGWLELPETQQRGSNQPGLMADTSITCRGEGVTERKQIEGVADHDMVMYDLAVGDAHRRFGYQARSHITRREAEVTKDEWEQHWSSYADVFNSREDERDARGMWDCLSNATEDFLQEEGSKGLPRSCEPRIQEITGARSGELNNCTMLLRRLHKLQRLLTSRERDPHNVELAMAVQKK